MQSIIKVGGALLVAAVVVGFGVKAIDAQVAPTADEPIQRKVLFRGDLEGVAGKEIVIFIADLAPGAIGAKHYHPGPEYFYVLEGALVHKTGDGPDHTMTVGEFSSNPDKSVHSIRNPDVRARAKAIDFLISEKGQPLVIPVN
jgi:quercetin dioxygenase-like cupin family protein